jgi:hypothetical protein
MMNKKDQSPKTPDEPKTSRRNFLKAGAIVAGVALLGDALKATATLAADQDQPNLDEVQLLFVQNARDAVMGNGRLTLIGINPTTIFFSDRPKRVASHMTTEDFVLEWREGKGKESFHIDPPNATLSIFGKDEIVDVVVELKNPRLAGGALIYDIDVVEEDEPIPSGPVSLFIDPLGVARRHRRRHRRRVRHVVR